MLSVRSKGNRLNRVPSPADLGRPLARYLRSGRPPGTAHRQVFLALGAPHGPLTAPAVESVTTRAMARAGTTGPGAGHRLRHTAAWGSAGGGFAGAGKLLRHTSRRRPLSTPGPTSPRSYHRSATAMASLAAESEAGPLPMQKPRPTSWTTAM